ncbi:hypothetical protein HCJ76_05790 [Streptomyces sp. MC1]|uniref:alpha-L-rhamnosidase-related protein n=1 Tax=Streptomyces sp. MC1 TaxID=295105 RepID=UPI0018CA7CC5|nr:hypothetical protein [Streptomyces sp. MC1]MBG7697608.1 hypothetical protein [Streptomyces sp. MC1]
MPAGPARSRPAARRQPGDDSPGLIANIAPEFHRVAPVKPQYPQGTIEFLGEVNWGGAVIRTPWQLYKTYGDTRTMSLYYDKMVKWLDYEAANKAANNGDIPGLGDWSAGDNTTPMQLAILAGYYTAAHDMAQVAGVLGKKADQDKYTELASNPGRRVHHEVPPRGRQGRVLRQRQRDLEPRWPWTPAWSPRPTGSKVLDRLVASVRTAGNHINSGSVGLGPLFRALHAGGRDDIIYDMVVNPTSPGYGNLVTSGQTTLSESLNGSGSQNHHFLGQVDAWLVHGLAGINRAPDSVAYRELEIAPAVVGDLTHAHFTRRSPLSREYLAQILLDASGQRQWRK